MNLLDWFSFKRKLLIAGTVRLLMSMKIDRIKDARITWSQMYNDQNTEQYQTLSDEVNYAVGWFHFSLGPFLSKYFPLMDRQDII